MAPPPRPMVVREVWQDNLKQEFSEITRALQRLPHHRFAAFDTEFPGIVFPAASRHHSLLSPAENYLLMKRNVDATKIIQLGLALSDPNGDSCYVWEFNFKGFDKESDLHNLESIQLLERQGIDFNKSREKGIDCNEFGRLLFNSGLLRNSKIAWVTFHGAYDFGYLIKISTRRELPSDLMEFMRLVVYFFGYKVFDIKHMIKWCEGLYGGLEKVSHTLGVLRVAGKTHQAGSDSLLTLQTMIKLKDLYFFGRAWINFRLILYSLEIDVGSLAAPKSNGFQIQRGCNQFYQTRGCNQQLYQRSMFVSVRDGMLYSI
ncbi:probable CCR4-associated factor 1 homolog 9 [Corylus avellana]|uniref:probable CCR4-associated factor 1 homolog 9 n=1 Tax=Corylus avellana TaxID=13451 RepID=UPI00286C02F7|nr:probable CCR4-associated factor 1 homolog 9 [Corylus avellana]